MEIHVIYNFAFCLIFDGLELKCKNCLVMSHVMQSIICIVTAAERCCMLQFTSFRAGDKSAALISECDDHNDHGSALPGPDALSLDGQLCQV